MYTCAMLACSFASSNTISSKISVCIAEEVQHYEEPKLTQFILEFKWQPPPNQNPNTQQINDHEIFPPPPKRYWEERKI